MRKAVKRMALSHQAAFFNGWQARVHNKQVSLHFCDSPGFRHLISHSCAMLIQDIMMSIGVFDQLPGTKGLWTRGFSADCLAWLIPMQTVLRKVLHSKPVLRQHICSSVQAAAVISEELIGHAKRLRARRRLIFTLRSWSVLAQEQAAARAQAQSLAARHDCYRSGYATTEPRLVQF